MHLAEERDAPPATGSSVEALAQLARARWLLALNEILHLANRHMKAEANLVVEGILGLASNLFGWKRGHRITHGITHTKADKES